MFNENQAKALGSELNPSRIKIRNKANIELSYIEGFDVIETANRIFGYGNWSYTITSLEQVSQETNQNQNFIICYKAVVNVKVENIEHALHVNRQDVGFGTGVSKTQADSHEGAAKEAVTDALKRSLRSFGNQFGNSLYDKSKTHQANNGSYPNNQNRQSNTQNNNQSTTNNQNSNDYIKLANLGLTIIKQGENLVVMGEDIFAKKDAIKSCGFRWDGDKKLWYKQDNTNNLTNNQQAA